MPIKNIVTNTEKLALVSEPVSFSDDIKPVIDALLDTAKYSAKSPIGCLGLAANQIGVLKRVIVVFISGRWVIMINPVITPVTLAGKTSGKETCLSRPGIKSFRKRFRKIDVAYTDGGLDKKHIRLSRFSARIVQHEVDHLNGIFI